MQAGREAIQLRGPGETHRAWHLRADGREVGRALALREEVAPAALSIHGPRREVVRHLAARGEGLATEVGVGVQLREALVLRAIEGLTQAEAAEALGVTEKTVETRLYRARLRLNEGNKSFDWRDLAVWGSALGSSYDGKM